MDSLGYLFQLSLAHTCGWQIHRNQIYLFSILMMIKTFAKLTLFFLPLFSMVGLVNYFIDPGHLFNDSYEQKVANALVTGYNLDHMSDCNDRRLQRLLVNKFNQRHQTLVLGSSHTLLVKKEDVKSKSFFNCGIAGQTIEDLMGIYLLYRERNLLPDTLFICADPWFLNGSTDQTRWIEYLPEIRKNCEANNLPMPKSIKSFYPNFIFRVQQLFSPAYFQLCLKEFFSPNKEATLKLTKSTDSKDMMKFADGSIRYDAKLINQDSAISQKKIYEFIHSRLGLLSDFDTLSVDKQAWLLWLFQDAKQNHIQLRLVLPCYEPQVYDYFKHNPKCRMFFKTEQWFREVANIQHIPIYGSYNPELYGLRPVDFYNGDHFKELAVSRILAQPN